MVGKLVFKQQRLRRPMHSNVMADKHMSRMSVFCKFHKHKPNPFSVLPVRMQEILIIIFATTIGFYMPLY